MKHLLVILFLSASTAFGNSYAMGVIDLPKADDIVAFTNGLPPSTGERVEKTKGQILYFLQHAKYADKYLREDDLAILVNRTSPSDGVFVDKAGKFYFWDFVSPTILKIVTPEGGSAVLKLDRPE